MAAPPPKQTTIETPEDLAEVERALSVLQGGTVELERDRPLERDRREAREGSARARPPMKREVLATIERWRLRSRRAIVGGLALFLGVVAVAGAIVFRSELARRGKIEQVTDPYRALGFVLVEMTGRGSPTTLNATVPAGCVIAADSTGPGTTMKLVHAGGVVAGPSPILSCLCEGGPVTVTTETKSGDDPEVKSSDGIALLRTDAAAFGGSRAFAFLPFKVGTKGRTDAECAEESLDAWLDAKRWSQESPEGTVRPLASVDPPTSERWFADSVGGSKRSVLKETGFVLSALVKRDAPFAVLDVPAETCLLLAPDPPTDRSSLRLRGGTIAFGPISGDGLWCTSAASLVLAQHEGAGDLAVLAVPASRVGGLGGAREIVEGAGVVLGAAAVPALDHGWSARLLLLASAIPESLVTVANAPEVGPDPEARLVSLSVEKPGALSVDTPPDVFSYCSPQLERATSSTCAFSGSQTWRVLGTDAVGGLARAKPPFWLFGLQGVNEPVALKLETELVGFARRLKRQGFEPTTIDDVTEVDKGAEVLGRANEDAMVAIQITKTSPWVIPLTDGPAWSFGNGEPRVVPIKPLERVVVTATKPTVLAPKASRRTVVFRRQQR